MFYLLKRLTWDLRDKYGRFNYVCALLQNLPGAFGIETRRPGQRSGCDDSTGWRLG